MTGPAEELFDLYDAAGRPLGERKPRDAVHRDGDWHRSLHLWVVTADRRLLFQRRALDKETWPGRLDASVGGHYRAGEGGAGVIREAREELGLPVSEDDLTPLGTRRVESRPGPLIDREHQEIYLLRCDWPLTAYRPDPAELAGLALLDADTAARLHAADLDEAEAEVLPCGAVMPTQALVGGADLIPGRSRYLAALVRAVDALLAGHPLPPGTLAL